MPEPTEILLETLRDAQRLGFFGGRPMEQAVEHAQAFVAALDAVPVGSRIVDLGSGGGLPGLVIAVARPSCSITLIDRREKRTDFLSRAVGRLGLDRVEVVNGDVRDLIRTVADHGRPCFDAVTARGFGPPKQTIRAAAQLIDRSTRRATAGVIVISEPPDGDRWDPSTLADLALTGERLGGGPALSACRLTCANACFTGNNGGIGGPITDARCFP